MPPRFPNTVDGLVAFYNFMYGGDRPPKLCPPHLIDICRALMDERIRKLLVTIGPGSGKSMLLSTVYPAFRIGQDPSVTVIGISAGERLIQGFQRAVMEWVEHSPRWAKAFPEVRPDKASGWSVSNGMFVTGRPPGDPDANYAAFGIDSSRLTGVHAKLIIMDDIHDKDNARNSDMCLDVRRTYYNTIIGRANPQGARFICAGRRWHEDDLYGHLSDPPPPAMSDWVHMNLPAEREGETDLYWNVTVPSSLQCCFTDHLFDLAPEYDVKPPL